MPFKKTRKGWVYVKDGKQRIPTKKGLFNYIPPVRDAETGHPIKDGKIDWERVIRESNERSQE
jgi:hypothetical protein